MAISGMGVVFENMAEERRLSFESLLSDLASKQNQENPS
jgi:hypothetical protein